MKPKTAPEKLNLICSKYGLSISDVSNEADISRTVLYKVRKGYDDDILHARLDKLIKRLESGTDEELLELVNKHQHQQTTSKGKGEPPEPANEDGQMDEELEAHLQASLRDYRPRKSVAASKLETLYQHRITAEFIQDKLGIDAKTQAQIIEGGKPRNITAYEAKLSDLLEEVQGVKQRYRSVQSLGGQSNYDNAIHQLSTSQTSFNVPMPREAGIEEAFGNTNQQWYEGDEDEDEDEEQVTTSSTEVADPETEQRTDFLFSNILRMPYTHQLELRRRFDKAEALWKKLHFWRKCMTGKEYINICESVTSNYIHELEAFEREEEYEREQERLQEQNERQLLLSQTVDERPPLTKQQQRQSLREYYIAQRQLTANIQRQRQQGKQNNQPRRYPRYGTNTRH